MSETSSARSEREADQPKKLILLSTVSSDARTLGGGEYFAAELLDGLLLRGWELTLVAAGEAAISREALRRPAVHTVPLDLSGWIGNPLLFVRQAFRLALLARGNRHCVFYGNGFQAMKWLAVAKLASKACTVCHLHESVYDAYHNKRSTLALKYVDRFLSISDAGCREFMAATGIEAEKMVRIYNGISIRDSSAKTAEGTQALRQRFGLPVSQPVVSMIARTDPWKGHDVFVRAIKQVLTQFPNVVFVIAGLQSSSIAEARIHARVVDLIASEQIDASVRIFGHSPEARQLMRCSDIVVVPSTAEGFGRVAVEAMAECTPIVVSRVGGLAEIVTHEHDGLWFTPGNSGELASCLTRLLGNPDLRSTLCVRGQRTATERFSMKTMLDAIEHEVLRVAAN